MRYIHAFGIAVILFGLSVSAASAQTLYGVTYGSQLITINTATGAGTLVGPLTPTMFSAGIAFRGNQLYTWDNTTSRIHELNPASAATLSTIDIGSTILGDGDLAFRSDGIGFLAGWSIPPSSLVRFDVTVPSSTPIGLLSPSMDGMAFNSADVLYGLSQSMIPSQGADPSARLYTIDTTTAAKTLVGDTGISGYAAGGIAFDASGNLYWAASANIGQPSFLYRVDPSTAAATLIGPIGFNAILGISFQPVGAVAGVTIAESGGTTNVIEGGTTDAYTIVLKAAPTANVTISVNASSQVAATPAVLTFTPANWSVPQPVTVTAVDDALVEGLHSGSITHIASSTDLTYNGLVIASVTANITDNDVGPPPPPPPPPPQPPPPSGGGNNEGNHPGSTGPSGAGEGGFGFGFGGMAPVRAPILHGPVASGANHRVRNVALQQRPADQAAANNDTGFGPFGWSLVLVLGAGAVILIKTGFA